MTAADLARLFRIPLGTVYRWAHEHHWRRSDPKHRPVRYELADAQATYDKMRHAQ